MKSRTMKKIAIPVLLSATAGFWQTQPARAAGFALMEQNSSGLGNAYAGAAATAEDASTIFFRRSRHDAVNASVGGGECRGDLR